MPGNTIEETLDKGLVTKRHSTMLAEGELQQSDDCVYRRFDPAIHIAPARSTYNSTAIDTKVKGLSFLGFNTGTDLLLMYNGNFLYSSDFTSLTGSFSAISALGTFTDGGDEIMNTVAYGNRHYILISGTTMRRIGYTKPPLITTTSNTVTTLTTLTTTNTKGFKSVIVGQYVSGSGGTGTIAAGARVLSKTSDTVVVLDTAGTNGTITTVIFSDTVFIQADYAGMKPVTEAVTVATTSGSWSTADDLGVGYYWFLYTEMLMPGVIDDSENGFLESGYVALPVSVNLTDPTTQGIIVTRGTVVNTNANNSNAATHWQVYMSDKQTSGTIQPNLATFKRIGSPIAISATTATFIDVNITQGPKTPTGNAVLTGYTQPTLPNGGNAPHDGIQASWPSGSGSTRGMKQNTYGFVSSGAVTGGTLTGSETVRGIEVKIYSNQLLFGFFTLKATGKASETKTFDSTPGFTVLGGATDTWGETWTPADFVDGTFFTEIIATNHPGGVLDGVTISVFYTGTQVNRNGVPFRTVTYRSQVGTSVTDTANLPPPIATTGDVFMGSLVVNDASDPSLIRFSLPGIADSFPKPYFLRFNLPRKNVVTNIKRVGQVLLVGLRDTVQRVNYLPSELDTNLQTGLAHEDLTTDHGIAGPHAATMFDLTDAGPVLAYVSYRGLHLTDGITTRFLNIDLDWANTVDLDNLGTCILTNYQQENWLVLFYPPAGTAHGKNTRALVFPYSPDKIKEGGFIPAVGPFKVSARSATAAVITGKTYLLTGHQALGKVFVEDQGLTLPTNYTVANGSGNETAITIAPIIKTRRAYPAGVGRQARVQRSYAMVSPFGSTFTVSSTLDGTTHVTSSAGFGSVVAGMRVTGSGIPLDTIVQTATDASNLTLSNAASSTGTSTLTFDSGTLSIAVSGQDINEATTTFTTLYQSTTTGGLIEWQSDNMKECLEVTFAKPALSTGLRIHYMAHMLTDAGQETHRS